MKTKTIKQRAGKDNKGKRNKFPMSETRIPEGLRWTDPREKPDRSTTRNTVTLNKEKLQSYIV